MGRIHCIQACGTVLCCAVSCWHQQVAVLLAQRQSRLPPAALALCICLPFPCRLLGVLGQWGGIARRCLQDLLPEDAHQR